MPRTWQHGYRDGTAGDEPQVPDSKYYMGGYVAGRRLLTSYAPPAPGSKSMAHDVSSTVRLPEAVKKSEFEQRAQALRGQTGCKAEFAENGKSVTLTGSQAEVNAAKALLHGQEPPGGDEVADTRDRETRLADKSQELDVDLGDDEEPVGVGDSSNENVDGDVTEKTGGASTERF